MIEVRVGEEYGACRKKVKDVSKFISIFFFGVEI